MPSCKIHNVSRKRHSRTHRNPEEEKKALRQFWRYRGLCRTPRSNPAKKNMPCMYCHTTLQKHVAYYIPPSKERRCEKLYKAGASQSLPIFPPPLQVQAHLLLISTKTQNHFPPFPPPIQFLFIFSFSSGDNFKACCHRYKYICTVQY